jgi:hypothetical protein
VETGRARLVTHIVTENATTTVPASMTGSIGPARPCVGSVRPTGQYAIFTSHFSLFRKVSSHECSRRISERIIGSFHCRAVDCAVSAHSRRRPHRRQIDLQKAREAPGESGVRSFGGTRWDQEASTNSQLDPSDIVGKNLYYTLVLFVLQFAFGVFGPNPVSNLLAGIIAIIIVIAAAFILFIGITAALNQIDVATTVTTPILIAVLAIIAGVIIVGASGGLVKPIQARWGSYLMKTHEKTPKIQQRPRTPPSIADQAKHAQQEAQGVINGDVPAPRAR